MSVRTVPWASQFDELHGRAAAQVGLRDFGGSDYHAGLRVLLDALDDRPPTGARGATARGLLISALASRLHTEAQWRADPGYRARTIPAPVIVMGMPRTGTTAMHGLLSQDPQFQGLERWLINYPLARPARDTWESHPQYQMVKAAIDQWIASGPEVMKAHSVMADEPDECLVPMAQSFTAHWFPLQLDLPLYDAWLLSADERPSYARYKDVLRLVGLRDDRRWLLKNPSHVFGIEALLAVFPDACVVHTHRHPVASLASLVNLNDIAMRAYTGEGIDRPRRLARETAFWAEAVRRAMAMADRHPERFVNVRQSDIRADPMGVVRRIYAHFGFAMSPLAETRHAAWAAANPPDGGSSHKYEPIADDAPILAAFAPYIARHAL